MVKSIDGPTNFISKLKTLNSEGKLTLALTKLLSREDLKPSAAPIDMIGALCDFGDEVAEIQRPTGFLDPLQALQNLVELHVEGTLKSADRLTRLSDGIRKSKGAHLPVVLARSEDYGEHRYAEANEFEKQNIGPHLERADVDKLNSHVAPSDWRKPFEPGN